jgi:hypothetical protein
MAIQRTDISGTITVGGTAQQLAAAKADRNGWYLQNHSTGDLWVSDMDTAIIGQPSLKIGPNQLYESPLDGTCFGALSIIGAITGQAFTAREW